MIVKNVPSPSTPLACALHCLRQKLLFQVDGHGSESLDSKISMSVWTGRCRLVCHHLPLVSFPDRGTKKDMMNLEELLISDSSFKVNAKGGKQNPAAVSGVAEMTGIGSSL